LLHRWGLQQDCALVPKSVKEARQKSNLGIWDFKLSQQDMEKLNALDRSTPDQNTMAGWLREHDPDFY
jgi:diketogulonate reductase-like aldo/keto reductase